MMGKKNGCCPCKVEACGKVIRNNNITLSLKNKDPDLFDLDVSFVSMSHSPLTAKHIMCN